MFLHGTVPVSLQNTDDVSLGCERDETSSPTQIGQLQIYHSQVQMNILSKAFHGILLIRTLLQLPKYLRQSILRSPFAQALAVLLYLPHVV